ncbi:sulfatase [Pseudopedobacter saltans DSM 12145]|uniref:Sulfatase n=1 Tax=Pseudopedobacter saltans (strain ATCC 51119 / DSM 12145 / JCM 21818 / CCUG 39354 / LMG 10337 / NBRC 100064 / NCIMB 13643) TaxID=762903 RepID=F0S8N7_PSESL|nr:sulfatase [Pseudopedobacter saltans]ADY52368.1 sulfatase [Pseudopedobacter saltans DSM 12145]
MNIYFKRVTSVLLSGALGLVAQAQTVQKKDKKLNIVFIMTDDHTTQALSAYDSRLIETPHLDRLAKEGIKFNNCFVTNAVCGPSRATILTGKYNHINGLTDNHKVFDSTQVIYPQLLKKAGYQTAMIGKWHLGSTPMGFDHYSILPNQGEYYQPTFIENGKKIQEKGYVTDVVTDKAIGYLESRDKEKPFLLIYQQKAPHRNWLPAQRHLGMFDDKTFVEPSNLLDDYSNRGKAAKEQLMNISKDMWDAWDLKLASSRDLDSLSKVPKSNFVDGKEDDFTHANDKTLDHQRFFQVFDRMTPEEKAAWTKVYDKRVEEYKRLNLKGDELTRWKYQQYMKDYLACVVAVDENVGRLMDYLEKEGELDNTIIVYTSDQGFFLGEHGFFDKRMMYEECLRTPLLIRYPNGIKKGLVSDALAMNVDFAPTLLDYAGVKIPKDMQGKSLKPVIDNDGKVLAKWRDAVYYHYYEYPSWHMVKRHYGIRTNRYKLIHFYNDIDEWELYDLEKDPKEMNNVYNNTAYANVVKMMHAKMKKLQKQYKDTNPTEE